MAKLHWTAKTAKRQIAEQAIRLALQQIDQCGGPSLITAHSYYQRAMHLIRHAEALLRQSEGDRG